MDFVRFHCDFDLFCSECCETWKHFEVSSPFSEEYLQKMDVSDPGPLWKLTQEAIAQQRIKLLRVNVDHTEAPCYDLKAFKGAHVVRWRLRARGSSA